MLFLGPVLPQVEGIAARFDSFLEEKTKEIPGSCGSANTPDMALDLKKKKKKM